MSKSDDDLGWCCEVGGDVIDLLLVTMMVACDTSWSEGIQAVWVQVFACGWISG